MSSSAVYDQRYLGDYRETLSGYEIARWEALDHFIKKVVKLSAASKVMDYGAGSGLYVPLWEKVFPTAELFFCDISPVAKEKFEAKFPKHGSNYFGFRKDMADCADNAFDVVVSIEVMEHVEQLDSYLQDVFRILKPGGRFVWTTPCANELSIEDIYNRITKQIEPTKEGFRRWRWEEVTHLRRLKSREIAQRLRVGGFDDIIFRFRAHFFSFVISNLPFRQFKHLRERVMTWDYELFRLLPNGASMIGSARKPITAA